MLMKKASLSPCTQQTLKVEKRVIVSWEISNLHVIEAAARENISPADYYKSKSTHMHSRFGTVSFTKHSGITDQPAVNLAPRSISLFPALESCQIDSIVHIRVGIPI